METMEEKKLQEFLKDNSLDSATNEIKYFKCQDSSGKSTIGISDITKRVNYIEINVY